MGRVSPDALHNTATTTTMTMPHTTNTANAALAYRYWGSVHVLVLILDFLCFVDIVSNMCTGFFMEKDMELG